MRREGDFAPILEVPMKTAHGLPTMKRYWMSCVGITVLVEVDGLDYINYTAPVCRSFIGQPRKNLQRWMERKFGGYQVQELSKESHE